MVVRGLVLRSVCAAPVVAVALLCASALPRVAMAAPAAADEELNAKGVALRQAGDNKGALVPLQQAYDLTHSPRATAQLGLVQQALGRWDLAEPLVAKAVQSRNDPWIKKYDAELTRALQIIRDHVAHVELVSDPSDADAFVNGSPIGHLPLAAPVAVAIGQADLELRAPGYRNAVRTLTLKPYQYERVFVRMERVGGLEKEVRAAGEPARAAEGGVATEAAGAADAAGPKPTAAGTDGLSRVTARSALKWTSLGLAGAALGTGIVASFIHSSKVDEFTNANGGGCFDDNGRAVDAEQKAVPECQGPLSAYRTARTWQIVGFVGAGAFAAAWLVLHLTESPETSTSAGSTARSHAWVCLPSLAERGAACSFRF